MFDPVFAFGFLVVVLLSIAAITYFAAKRFLPQVPRAFLTVVIPVTSLVSYLGTVSIVDYFFSLIWMELPFAARLGIPFAVVLLADAAATWMVWRISRRSRL